MSIAHHLSCFGHESELIIQTRRFKCSSCHRSFVPELPGVQPYRHSSAPLRNYIYEQQDIYTSALSRRQNRVIASALNDDSISQSPARQAIEIQIAVDWLFAIVAAIPANISSRGAGYEGVTKEGEKSNLPEFKSSFGDLINGHS